MNVKKPFDKNIEIEELEARDIMIPRSMIVYLLAPFSKQEALEKFKQSKSLFLPVAHKSLDNIVGVCSLQELSMDESFISHNFKINFLAENQRFFEIMNSLNNDSTPLGVVVDEFGGCCGLISQESIINFFSNFNINGSESINRFTHIIPHVILSSIKSETIGGFVMEYLEKIPKEGDSFILNNYQFTILEMSKNTIKSIALRAIKEK